MAIEALSPLNRTSHVKMYENIARSRPFCRIAERSIVEVKYCKIGVTEPSSLASHRISSDESFVSMRGTSHAGYNF